VLTDGSRLTSRRPYLLRAMHEWITDNDQTPHVVVDAGVEGVDVPDGYVREGKIILNVSYIATSNLKLGNDSIEFCARFGGVTRDVTLPVVSVLGIYARESGQGMIFAESETPPDPPDGGPGPDTGGEAGEASRRAHLKVVK
jgi:stringent starvation protein B